MLCPSPVGLRTAGTAYRTPLPSPARSCCLAEHRIAVTIHYPTLCPSPDGLRTAGTALFRLPTFGLSCLNCLLGILLLEPVCLYLPTVGGGQLAWRTGVIVFEGARSSRPTSLQLFYLFLHYDTRVQLCSLDAQRARLLDCFDSGNCCKVPYRLQRPMLRYYLPRPMIRFLLTYAKTTLRCFRLSQHCRMLTVFTNWRQFIGGPSSSSSILLLPVSSANTLRWMSCSVSQVSIIGSFQTTH